MCLLYYMSSSGRLSTTSLQPVVLGSARDNATTDSTSATHKQLSVIGSRGGNSSKSKKNKKNKRDNIAAQQQISTITFLGGSDRGSTTVSTVPAQFSGSPATNATANQVAIAATRNNESTYSTYDNTTSGGRRRRKTIKCKSKSKNKTGKNKRKHRSTRRRKKSTRKR